MKFYSYKRVGDKHSCSLAEGRGHTQFGGSFNMGHMKFISHAEVGVAKVS